MNRRDFLKSGAAAAGTGMLGLASCVDLPRDGAEPAVPGSTPQEKELNCMDIRQYLCREAQRTTDKALTDFTDAETWRRLIPERRNEYVEMMGLSDLPPFDKRPPLNVRVTGVLKREGYRIEKLYYESLPKLYVAANLYVPENIDGAAPGVVYVCGHSSTQKVHYQAHPRRFAQLGFVCIVVETVQLGEVRGYHHGCYREGWFHWYSRGYTPAGIELLNGIRALDLLAQRPEVNADRLGVTGISGGGATSWWLAAGDERIKVAAPVCGTATLASHIIDRTIDGHCDCMWFINTYLWDLADVGGLIAPRPLLIGSANRDAIFTIASIREVHAQLQRLYDLLGASDNLKLIETPGGHSYHERSRTGIFSWFIKHLKDQDVPPEEVGDIDESKQESEDDLRVFVNGPPPEDRTKTIHDDFPKIAKPPDIRDATTLESTREALIKTLREKTFRAFPEKPVALDAQVTFEFESGGAAGYRFGYTSEEGVRLHGRITFNKKAALPIPAVVALRSPGESRNATEGYARRVRAPWAKVVIEPRGTGETGCAQQRQWHLRRSAAWTGRTLASIRAYDTLRALEAVRSLPKVDANQVSLSARGEMAAVALYAALLYGKLKVLFLETPPATQNASSEPDGTGPAIEMLSCLRFTDLAQIAGLLWPVELVLIGKCPETYNWSEDLYQRLGSPGKIVKIGNISEWQPSERET